MHLQSSPQNSVNSFPLPPISSHCSLSVSLCRDSVSTSLHPELHIERIRGLTSWSCESHLKRCRSWADTQASPRLVIPCSSCNRRGGERKPTMVWQIAFSYFSFLWFIPSPYCTAAHQHHPHPSATPPSCFPSRSILWNGRPIAVVMREVNWPCCVFRRLDSDGGGGLIGGVTIFSIFSGCPPAYPLLFAHNLKSSLLRVLFI